MLIKSQEVERIRALKEGKDVKEQQVKEVKKYGNEVGYKVK